jgi:hypothetical protein
MPHLMGNNVQSMPKHMMLLFQGRGLTEEFEQAHRDMDTGAAVIVGVLLIDEGQNFVGSSIGQDHYQLPLYLSEDRSVGGDRLLIMVGAPFHTLIVTFFYHEVVEHMTVLPDINICYSRLHVFVVL